MLALDQTRTIEILQPAGWTPASLVQLEKGDVYRICEPDGTPVLNQHGVREFRALSWPNTTVEALSVQESASIADRLEAET